MHVSRFALTSTAPLIPLVAWQNIRRRRERVGGLSRIRHVVVELLHALQGRVDNVCV